MLKRFSKSAYQKTACLHWLAIFFIILDRWLKAWVTITKPSTDSLWSLTYSLNANLAFSVPFHPAFILLIIGLIILGLSYYYLKLLKAGAWPAGLIFMLLLGSGSNLVDRLIYGGVIDYWNFGSLTVFNLADALIVFSLGWWLFWEIGNGNRATAISTSDKV